MQKIGSDPKSSELIQRWRERRREILKTLPPELRAEYRRLGMLIKTLLAEQADNSPIGVPTPREKGFLDLSRNPLFKHKNTLLNFLRTRREPVSRKDILKGTKIPEGSLSSLLRAGEFEQAGRGLWKLKEAVK